MQSLDAYHWHKIDTSIITLSLTAVQDQNTIRPKVSKPMSKADSSTGRHKAIFYIRNPDYVGRATNTIPQGNTSSLTFDRLSNLPTPTVFIMNIVGNFEK